MRIGPCAACDANTVNDEFCPKHAAEVWRGNMATLARIRTKIWAQALDEYWGASQRGHGGMLNLWRRRAEGEDV